MARRRKLDTYSDFNNALKNGYGKGQGKTYKPWVRVQDVPSKGNSGKIEGIKSGRQHHTLSEGESCFFYLAEFCNSVIDIREQFPLLPLNLSIKIAKHFDIKHPKVPKTKYNNVMTFDFMLTRKKGKNIFYEAVSVKPLESFLTSEKKRQRVAEKLEIERIWCELLDIPYHLFVMTKENRVISENIQWLTSSVRRKEQFNNEKICQHATNYLNPGTYLLPELCSDLKFKFQLTAEEAMRLFKELVVNRYIQVDLSYSIVETEVINIITVSKNRDTRYVG